MEKSEAAHQLPSQPVKKEETTFPPFGRPALLMLTQHYSLLISPEDPPRLPTVGFLKNLKMMNQVLILPTEVTVGFRDF